jgi:HAD superfamily hydrolase (TIGR01509 family)
MIKAILYDLDGVLVDATEWHYDALNKALAVLGYEITREEHLRFYNGLPTRKKLETLSREKGFPLALKEFVNELKQVYTRDVIFHECRPSFEKRYMLSRFKKEGLRQVVCSNSIRASIDLMLNRTELMEYVEFFIGNDEISKPKPDPEMYVLAMRKLGLGPQECVILEDAPHGIQAARASGAHVCEVKGFDDVNYFRVREFIKSVEGKSHGS